jgi:hypothetical protein
MRSPSGRSASVLKPHGTLILTPGDGGPVIEADTVMCVHCNRHWVWQQGSGRKRGWCMRCNGITCGLPTCDACVPLEQRLENWEHGRPTEFRPTVAAVGVNISGGQLIL